MAYSKNAENIKTKIVPSICEYHSQYYLSIYVEFYNLS